MVKQLPIHVACLTGNKSTLRKIIDAIPRKVLETKDSLGRTPLILTVTHNHVECGALLLKAGVHVDNSDNAGQTALHVAASKGFHRFVKLLLSYKASWMQGDYFGVTSLHMAAIHPNVKSLSIILKCLKPGEIDFQDSTMKTPLHWSAAYGYNDHIKLLLAQGANICIPDDQGKTPLHWAAVNSDPEALECVKTLLREKKEVNPLNWQDYQGRSALHIAVATGSVEILYFLASKEDCNVDVFDNSFCTPLHWATKKGYSEKADILLRKRANHSSADDNGATPLHYAAHNNHAETVEVFMSRHYIHDEPDRLGRFALMWAAIKNSVEAFKVIATSSTDLVCPDRNGATILHAAAILGHVSVIEILLDLDVSVDIIDKNGMTPFLKSCEFGRSKTAQLLLDRGADIHAFDLHKCSALHWCARGGHAYLSQILIKHGAHFEVQDVFGMTPLHYCSVLGDFINCTSVLLESGADPNAIDIEGKTPLHFAVLNERKGITRLLSEHDSDVNAMFLMDDWFTPLDCALWKETFDIISLLKKYGAMYAHEIKEIAAVVIQTWFRRKRERKKALYTGCDSSKKTFGLPHHIDLLTDKCYLPSEVPLILQNNLKDASDLYHECNGCFHKVVCYHVCAKDIKPHLTENEAAVIIQRTWKKYLMKKQFFQIRLEVSNAFCNGDDRMIAEELWLLRLQSFNTELYKEK